MDRSEIKRVVWIGGGCGSMFCFNGVEPSVLLAQCSPRYQNRNRLHRWKFPFYVDAV